MPYKNRIKYFIFTCLVIVLFLESCKKQTDTDPNSTAARNTLDSINITESILFTNFGFGNPQSISLNCIYDNQNRVSQIPGNLGTKLKHFYYPDGRLSHIIAEFSQTFTNVKERASNVFRYSGNKIIKAIYRQNSVLPETDSYYSDTLRTDNNNGYYDSLIYSGNNLTEVHKKTTFGIQTYLGKYKIKYPNGSDSTYSLEEYNLNNILETRLSGKISHFGNPYKPYINLFFYYSFNINNGPIYIPSPLRRTTFRLEYLIACLPNAIRTFKTESIHFTGIESGSYLYQMSADSLNLKMTNPEDTRYNYERVNYFYKRVAN
jgi:hypothetical protein